MSAKLAESNIEMIRALIQGCRDDQAGFLMAAEPASNSDLKAFFISRSMERARFAAELDSVARRLGEEELARSSGTAGLSQSAWIDLKLKRRPGDIVVLRTVAMAEANTRNTYRQALAAGFPPEVESILERQAESVSDAYDQVCTLRDMRGKAA
jgi:uncharacterized protein (TIGR02284 family)